MAGDERGAAAGLAEGMLGVVERAVAEAMDEPAPDRTPAGLGAAMIRQGLFPNRDPARVFADCFPEIAARIAQDVLVERASYTGLVSADAPEGWGFQQYAGAMGQGEDNVSD